MGYGFFSVFYLPGYHLTRKKINFYTIHEDPIKIPQCVFEAIAIQQSNILIYKQIQSLN